MTETLTQREIEITEDLLLADATADAITPF